MEDKKIFLRALKADDAHRMLEWMQNEDVVRYLTIGGKDTKLETVQNFIKSASDDSENIHRAIIDENDTYLGTVSLKHVDRERKEAEYAISMHMDAIGTGASKSATELILRLAFDELKLDRIVLCVSESNKRAVRFYDKCGFRVITCPGYGNYLNSGLIWLEQRNNVRYTD